MRRPRGGCTLEGGLQGRASLGRPSSSAVPLRPALLALLLGAAPLGAQEVPDDVPVDGPIIEDVEVARTGRTQTDEERLYDRLVARFQREYLQFTALVQVHPSATFGDAGGDASDTEAGFRIRRARFGVRGRLDGGFGYRLQLELGDAPSLRDAYISYGRGVLQADVGRFDVPFSFEELTSGSRLDFIERSRVVNAIAPSRSVGAAARVRLLGEALAVRAGVYNAVDDRLPLGGTASERDGLLGAVRVESDTDIGIARLSLGANAGYESAGDVPEARGVGARVPARTFVGADARLRAGRFLLGVEALYDESYVSFFDDPLFPEPPDPDRFGYHVTAGVDLDADDRVLVRVDHFELSTDLLLGVSRTFTRAAQAQANLILPDIGDPRVVVNLQLGF